MKTTIFILTVISFLQTTIIPVNLVLIILICKSIIDQDENNLFLAFGFGLFNAHLTLGNLGLQSFLYLILIQITLIVSRWRFSIHWLQIYPLTVLLLSIYVFALAIVGQRSVQIFPQVFIESLFSLPVYFIIKLWQERFIVKKDIKLKF